MSVEGGLFALSILANIASVIGIPILLLQVSELLRTRSRVRRLVPLLAQGDVSIIVTTSDWRENPRGVGRGLAGYGALKGIECASRFLSRNFPNRNVKIDLSRRAPPSSTADLLLIGGPAKNERTAALLERLAIKFPDQLIIRTDRDDRHLNVSGLRFPPSAAPKELQEGEQIASLLPFQRSEIALSEFLDPETEEPRYDYGIVISAPNLLAGSGRALVLYGFSSSGTATITQWFFEKIWQSNIAQDFQRRLDKRRAEGFVAVVELRRDSVDTGEKLVCFKELYSSELAA